MARKLRLEYPGALYHVYNRGNYRAHIFREAGARQAFLKCVLSACEKSGWVLHAYVIMGNHYHLAVETPRGNLVEGMKWLQSTFANHFNRFRSEHGHVFQGRYHAKLLENDAALAAVAHYIHLNPVKAGLVEVDKLGEFKDSSYWALLNRSSRPDCLQVNTFLTQVGKLADTKVGHRSYAQYLAFVAANKAEQKRLAFDQACKGWAQGSAEWKQKLVEEHRDLVLKAGHCETDTREARALLWEACVLKCLARLRKDETELAGAIKSAPWKVAIAAHMKAVSAASNVWLAARLQMGAPAGVSRYVSELHAGQRAEAVDFLRNISNITV